MFKYIYLKFNNNNNTNNNIKQINHLKWVHHKLESIIIIQNKNKNNKKVEKVENGNLDSILIIN